MDVAWSLAILPAQDVLQSDTAASCAEGCSGQVTSRSAGRSSRTRPGRGINHHVLMRLRGWMIAGEMDQEALNNILYAQLLNSGVYGARLPYLYVEDQDNEQDD